MTSWDGLFSVLGSAGVKAVALRPERMREACEEILERCARGETDPEISEWYLKKYFRPEATPAPEWASSPLVMAVPSPVSSVLFEFGEGNLVATIPPTYIYGEGKERISALLAEQCPDVRLVFAPGPRKLLAARSGLARYGRNNVCYVEGMGSMVGFAAFFCDLPCEEDAWGEVRFLERCASCGACARSCPSKCIDEDRFVIHADHCLTFANERKEGEPEHLPREWHHTLVGCLHCQAVCPENAGRMKPIPSGVVFSGEETASLATATDLSSLPEVLRGKLQRLNMDEYLDVLGRNLSLLRNATGLC